MVPLSTPGKYPVPIVKEAGWVQGPVQTGAENLISTGFRSPDRPARSQSLYRLNYRAHIYVCTYKYNHLQYMDVCLVAKQVTSYIANTC
jgi:hypothetical protein